MKDATTIFKLINRFLTALLITGFCTTAQAQPDFIETDVVILGGSPSGLAAAVQAARLGCTVIVAEPYRHIGGMMAGGLTRTDLGDRNTTGGIAKEFFQRVAAHYDPSERPWMKQKMKFFFEPHVAEDIWWEMVRESGRINVLVSTRLVDLRKDGKVLKEITVREFGLGKLPPRLPGRKLLASRRDLSGVQASNIELVLLSTK